MTVPCNICSLNEIDSDSVFIHDTLHDTLFLKGDTKSMLQVLLSFQVGHPHFECDWQNSIVF